jgi:hypothetical protein
VDGTLKTPDSLVDGRIVELRPDNTIAWEWNTADHSDFSDTVLPICFDIDTGPGTDWALDLAHINAIDVFPNGDLLVDVRHFSALMRVDKTTGDIEWKLGGTVKPGISLTVVGDPANGPSGPHDGRVLSDGAVTMHDNGVAPGGTTNPRAVEYAIDTTAMTATLTWSYTSLLNQSTTLGSVRRQPDGNTVIGWGAAWTPWLEEVTATGQRVLTVASSPPATFYRVVKLAEATYSRDQLRSLAGGATMAPATG